MINSFTKKKLCLCNNKKKIFITLLKLNIKNSLQSSINGNLLL